MAVIVQADTFKSLIRKVGYSVGLEDLVNRVTALTRLYVKDRRVTYVSWKNLVTGEFGRKESARKGQKSAAEHIADFFSTLNLIKLTNKEVTTLQGLEVCSILYRFFEQEQAEEKFRTALQVILTTYLVEADGDIFLNCLAADFDVDRSKQLLEGMVNAKRTLLTHVIKQPALQRRILDVIDIKSQPSQKTGSSGPHDSSPFARRSVPLASLTRRQPLGIVNAQAVDISPDYMRKVLPTRRGWARALDLVTDDSVSQSGQTLIEELSKLGYRDGLGPFLVWPFAIELQKLRIAPEDLRCGQLREWDLLAAVGKCFGADVLTFDESKDYLDIVHLLRRLFQLYKEGSSIAGVLRHQLPIFIAQPCVVAIKAALRSPIPPLPQIVDHEIVKTRRIFFANIRGTEGGLVIGDDQK